MSAARARVAAAGLAAGLAAALACAGCGYSFSGSSAPGHIRTVAVPAFGNETLDGLIAEEVTRGLSDRFLEDNRLKLAREAMADCVLAGRVTHYERRVYSYTAAQEPEDYIVIVRIAAVLQDRVRNRDLWTAEHMEATAVYPASGGSGTSEAGSGEGGARPGNEQEARLAAIR
ncbi:MAG: hypothetical protein FJY75_07380, partial [Candidatus Eisenbacteria bacterium]|nr:hypothetical protein [Candidatus Eisenbacteria bacterium]